MTFKSKVLRVEKERIERKFYKQGLNHEERAKETIVVRRVGCEVILDDAI